ncbi:MAG: hypothetical protein Q4G03_06490 [Planctomycetia bacterium]|nr:hypothetical protein [Planctomycetia bacterium]
MDRLTEIVQISQQLETLLQKRFKAVGRGLHGKITSVQSKIPEAVVRKLRYIATLRNKAVHEDANIANTEYNSFHTAYEEVMLYFNRAVHKQSEKDLYFKGLKTGLIIGLLVGGVVGVLLALAIS